MGRADMLAPNNGRGDFNWNLLQKIVLVAIIILLLFWKGCDKTVVVEKVPPVQNLVKEDAKDQVLNKKMNDSFKIAMDLQKDSTAMWKLRYEDLMTDYLNQENDFSVTLSQKVPDTCQKYQQELTAKFNKIISTNNQKTKAANGTISSLEKQLKTKDNFLSEKDRQLAKSKANWDSCIATAFKLESNNEKLEKLQPRSEVNGGLSGMTGFAGNYNPAIGIVLGYRSEKGLDISAAYYTNKIATITAKKTIFKFKHKKRK